MKTKLEFNDTTKSQFGKKFFQEIFLETMKIAEISCLEDKSIELSVALVSEEKIVELNSQYRKKNRATDVLSFCEYEKTADICKDESSNIYLGELIVCPDYIAKVSAQEKEPLNYSLKYIVAHGILHLLGFTHGKKMFALQLGVADKLENKTRRLRATG